MGLVCKGVGKTNSSFGSAPVALPVLHGHRASALSALRSQAGAITVGALGRTGRIVLLRAGGAVPTFSTTMPAAWFANWAACSTVAPAARPMRPRAKVRQGSFCKVYTIPLQAGKTYQVDMVSNQLDSYLWLEDPNGQQLAEDDDGGGFPNARIAFNCPKNGVYRIIATTFAAGATGAFTLTVAQR